MKGYSGFLEIQSDCLVSYLGQSLARRVGSYPSAEIQLVYSTAGADWAANNLLNLDFRKFIHKYAINNEIEFFCYFVY